ncbi:DUF2625 domain-containing protein [Pseudomonas sp.]|uniref:DUF2625 domain-containing protein n=1 Tax=Pseudomonas sp. TaxID=306 RepID=UPI003FD757EB
MKCIEDLVEINDPAMIYIREMLEQADRHYDLLPPSPQNTSVLLQLQVTTKSTLGAIAFETGGILIDHGWLRILGSGHQKLTRTLAGWSEGRAQGHLLVADDAAGGCFSINGGGLGDDVGAVYYWAPDNLLWEPLGIGYTAFLEWAVSNRTAAFYEGLRWESWRDDIQRVSGDQCVSFYPFLWTQEGSVAISARRVVSMAEQYDLNCTLAGQL